MVYTTDNIYPVSFLQRYHLAKTIIKQAGSSEHFTGLHDFLEIESGPEFMTFSLGTSDDSFYKSLSIIIFADELHARLIRTAVLQYAKRNEHYFHNMFREEAPMDEHYDGVFDFLRKSWNRQASYVEVYVAADMLKTTIFLFENDNCLVPHPFRPLSQQHDSNTGILIAVDPTGDGRTFRFSPVISYTRQTDAFSTFDRLNDLDIFDPDCENDFKYHITFLASDTVNSVSIPYVILDRFSHNLSEFIGEVLETSLSIDCLRRLKTFILSSGAYPKIGLDHEMYEFAKKWNLQILIDDVNSVIGQRSLEDVVDFINQVSLGLDSELFQLMRRRLYQAKLHELKSIRFNGNSEAHQCLGECLTRLFECKRHSKPLVKYYDLPHVVLCFNEMDPYPKYFNGEQWCPLFVPEQVRSLIQFIEPNRCCILDDVMYLLTKGNRLVEMKILNAIDAVPFTRSMSKQIKDPRLNVCSDNSTILAISDETSKMVCEILRSEDDKTLISDWRRVEADKFRFRFLGEDGIIYNVGNKMCCMTSCDTTLVGCLEDKCYVYRLKDDEPSFAAENQCHITEVPPLANGKYILLSRNTFQQHFTEFY